MRNSDEVYLKLLEEEEKKLRKRIAELEAKREFTNRIPIKLEGLKLQQQALKDKIEEYNERGIYSDKKEEKLYQLDAQAESIIEKQIPIERKIAELEALRQRAETTVEEKYNIRKEIAHQKQMLYSLKGKNIAINRKQRKIMISKFHKEQKREKLLGKQQGKVSVYEDRLDRIAELQEMLSPEDSFIDRIKNGYYNLKGKYYERKLNRAEEVLEIMQQSDSNIVVRGANVVNLGRRAVDTLRNRMHRSRETAETLANSAPTQNNPGTALSVVVR